eukprot:7952825-Pyramimonas_sp.AAC.1
MVDPDIRPKNGTALAISELGRTVVMLLLAESSCNTPNNSTSLERDAELRERVDAVALADGAPAVEQ